MLSGVKLNLRLYSLKVAVLSIVATICFCFTNQVHAQESEYTRIGIGEFVVQLKDSELLVARKKGKRRRVGLHKSKHRRWKDISKLSFSDVEQILEGCEELKRVYGSELEYCEPNREYRTTALPNESANSKELFERQWGIDKISAPDAWNKSTGSKNVTVAIIDTGVDYNHPDLSANMWKNSGEIPANGIDDDGNGVVDDVFGFNAINTSGDPMDDHGHGTHVAGTVGAVGNNGLGVAGVAWNVKLMAVKFLGASGGGTTFQATAAINYAVEMGADIINASWGASSSSSILADAVKDAVDAGVLFVAAAGNSGLNTDQKAHYPSGYDYPGVIAVGASDSSDGLASFSNYGSNTVDIAAPGVGIISTFTGGRYASLSGTSMASPQVAGAAAVIKAFDGGLTHLEIKSRILNNGDYIPAFTTKIKTSARLNLNASLVNSGSGDSETVAPQPAKTLNAKVRGPRKSRRVLKESRLFTVEASGVASNTLVSLEIAGQQCELIRLNGDSKVSAKLRLKNPLKNALSNLTIVVSAGEDTVTETRRIKRNQGSKRRRAVKRLKRLKTSTLEQNVAESCERIRGTLKVKSLS
jgi:subtilisin family serine protease